jgi:putative transcriptional regulator
MMLKLPHWLGIAAAFAAAWNAPAQSMQVKDLAVGKLLVCPRKAPDPSFAGTVILLVQLDHDSALGLMVNRRTKTPISRALADWKPARGKSDPVYMGGPVELDGVMALLRADAKPSEAAPVLGDIYVAASRTVVEKALTAGSGPGGFRLYLGYCGWGPGQLQSEVALGAWYIFSGNDRLVFDSDPDSLWTRLIALAEDHVARGREPARGACCLAAWNHPGPTRR